MGNALESAVLADNTHALKAFKPDPKRIDFDSLYGYCRRSSCVELLAGIQLPTDIGRVLRALSASITWDEYGQGDPFLAALRLGVRWESAEKDELKDLRR